MHPREKKESCLFCQWYGSRTNIITETRNTVTFLATLAVRHGHVLVCPKEHYTDITSTPPKLRAELFDAAVAMIPATTSAFNTKAAELLLNHKKYIMDPDSPLHVPHLHIHVVPRTKGDPIKVTAPRIEFSAGQAAQYIKKLQEQLTPSSRKTR